MPGQLRIIGGNWRSRKIPVPVAPDLRPTPDRVRETLFNWLMPYISGARCLDLYAGTGALGFEALSRGAGYTLMVERNRKIIEHLSRTADRLGARSLDIVCMDANKWMKTRREAFDIIFLDPPFSQKPAGNNILQLIDCGCIKKGSLVYIESDDKMEIPDPRINVLKSSRAGNIQFKLLSFQD